MIPAPLQSFAVFQSGAPLSDSKTQYAKKGAETEVCKIQQHLVNSLNHNFQMSETLRTKEGSVEEKPHRAFARSIARLNVVKGIETWM